MHTAVRAGVNIARDWRYVGFRAFVAISLFRKREAAGVIAQTYIVEEAMDSPEKSFLVAKPGLRWSSVDTAVSLSEGGGGLLQALRVSCFFAVLIDRT